LCAEGCREEIGEPTIFAELTADDPPHVTLVLQYYPRDARSASPAARSDGEAMRRRRWLHIAGCTDKPNYEKPTEVLGE
jgi:hypothetical protein